MLESEDFSFSSKDTFEEKRKFPLQPSGKKRKLNEEERLKRCRERNRVHARNTRERKKIQLDMLQYRIQELIDEKMKLKNKDADTSVATILMSLAGVNSLDALNKEDEEDPLKLEESPPSLNVSQYARIYTDKTIEKLRQEVSNILADNEDFDIDQELLHRDKSSCTSNELDLIRRERNRMHAKRTRLRKKKMLQEMETIVFQLENEIKELCREKGISPVHIVQGALEIVRSGSPNSRGSKRDTFNILTPLQNKFRDESLSASEYSSLTKDHLSTRDSKSFRDKYNLEHHRNFQRQTGEDGSNSHGSSSEEDCTTRSNSKTTGSANHIISHNTSSINDSNRGGSEGMSNGSASSGSSSSGDDEPVRNPIGVTAMNDGDITNHAVNGKIMTITESSDTSGSMGDESSHTSSDQI